MFKDIYWMSSLTMEEVFIVTGLSVCLVGGIVGFVTFMFDEPPVENEEEK